jgi:ABC-type sugar transport system permease subunit
MAVVDRPFDAHLPGTTPRGQTGAVRALTKALLTWPYLIPILIFFIGWQIYPIFLALKVSFTDEQFLSGQAAHWIGFQNYTTVLRDHLFWLGLGRAAIFTALFVPGMIMIPMVLAVMIDKVGSNRIATLYRLVLLIPAMIPAPLIFLLWRWMYDLRIGPINYLLVDVLHLYTIQTQPQWLGDPHIAFFYLDIMEWWWGLGYHTMFFLAGLATVPRDLFDAARLDGANEWRLFWGITVPRLLPVILVLAVLRFGSAMAVIDEYLIMGAFDRTRPTYTWTVYMWDQAFGGGMQPRGYAAAIGWLGAIAMLIVVIGMFYLFRSRD